MLSDEEINLKKFFQNNDEKNLIKYLEEKNFSKFHLLKARNIFEDQKYSIFYLAFIYDMPNLINFILKKGYKFEELDENNMTIFHLAARYSKNPARIIQKITEEYYYNYFEDQNKYNHKSPSSEIAEIYRKKSNGKDILDFALMSENVTYHLLYNILGADPKYFGRDLALNIPKLPLNKKNIYDKENEKYLSYIIAIYANNGMDDELLILLRNLDLLPNFFTHSIYDIVKDNNHASIFYLIASVGNTYDISSSKNLPKTFGYLLTEKLLSLNNIDKEGLNIFRRAAIYENEPDLVIFKMISKYIDVLRSYNISDDIIYKKIEKALIAKYSGNDVFRDLGNRKTVNYSALNLIFEFVNYSNQKKYFKILPNFSKGNLKKSRELEASFKIIERMIKEREDEEVINFVKKLELSTDKISKFSYNITDEDNCFLSLFSLSIIYNLEKSFDYFYYEKNCSFEDMDQFGNNIFHQIVKNFEVSKNLLESVIKYAEKTGEINNQILENILYGENKNGNLFEIIINEIRLEDAKECLRLIDSAKPIRKLGADYLDNVLSNNIEHKQELIAVLLETNLNDKELLDVIFKHIDLRIIEDLEICEKNLSLMELMKDFYSDNKEKKIELINYIVISSFYELIEYKKYEFVDIELIQYVKFHPQKDIAINYLLKENIVHKILENYEKSTLSGEKLGLNTGRKISEKELIKTDNIDSKSVSKLSNQVNINNKKNHEVGDKKLRLLHSDSLINKSKNFELHNELTNEQFLEKLLPAVVINIRD